MKCPKVSIVFISLFLFYTTGKKEHELVPDLNRGQPLNPDLENFMETEQQV